jgi:hypothetical protein
VNLYYARIDTNRYFGEHHARTSIFFINAEPEWKVKAAGFSVVPCPRSFERDDSFELIGEIRDESSIKEFEKESVFRIKSRKQQFSGFLTISQYCYCCVDSPDIVPLPPATMAPNQSNTLIYENEDVEKVKTYEKKGELLSRESHSTIDNALCRKVPLPGGK